MTDTEQKTETEEKILDAALKVFARKGYDAATTRSIAEESGFTEMTLFRKFGTKKNLFEQVMNRGNQQIEKDAEKLFLPGDKQNTSEFIRSFIKRLDNFVIMNFEYFHLTIVENSSTIKPNLGLTIDYIGKYFKEQFTDRDLDYTAFGFSISTFIYSLNIDRYYGRTATFGNFEKSLDKLSDILECMLEN
ncbi:MAG TPA: TetR/AcrR family transcriptional regulator [Methanobacterium sp.]|nr:TetR/AcrR family transcriptional regulator [Methanobacterium sp.]